MNNDNEFNIKIIGLGGIGTHLVDPLFRYMNHKPYSKVHATLIDGDIFEFKNLERQTFISPDQYKASQKEKELQNIFPDIKFESINEYINDLNISHYIDDKDIIFLCVDNHKTRKVVNDYVNTLDNIILISGGNEYTDGNVQLFFKREGEKQTPSLTDYHPEILNFNDKSPEEMSCEELHDSSPQLIFTNLFASTIMVSLFYNVIESMGYVKDLSEIYFDIIQMRMEPKIRKVK